MNAMRTRRGRARIGAFMVIVFVVVGLFVVRLVDIQVVRAAELNEESYGKRAQSVTTHGLRGDIVDRNGEVLADGVERYEITASPKVALINRDEDDLRADLEKVAEVTGGDAEQMLRAVLADPESDFLYLARAVDLDTLRAVRDLGIGWVYDEVVQKRVYPNGAIAGNLVGFMGTDGAQAGLEYMYDESCLAGDDGTVVFERSADGVRLPGSELVEKQSRDGGVLETTLDRDLQWYLQERIAKAYNQLEAEWATAVVMRVSDGALMAVVDYPSVDPNNVAASENTDLGARSFSTPYEPGSIMKPITAASLIDAGVATPQSGVVAGYARELPDGTNITDSYYHEAQNMTLTGMIVNSSNTATSLFSDLLPAEQRHQYLLDFGFGASTEAEFSGESSGVVLPTSSWDVRTNYAVQFGQAIQTTAIQMASAYQTIGNGGVRMPVHLVEGCRQADGSLTEQPTLEGERIVSETAAAGTVNMMEMLYRHGTSAEYLDIPGYRVAAKSGTAEVAENGAYVNKAVISYAGLVPAEDPQYAVIVSAGIPSMILSGVIAPTFRDVVAQTLTTFRVPPSTEPVTELPIYW
jgi:cell division protein FtsI (penicillin-binding protein 3)